MDYTLVARKMADLKPSATAEVSRNVKRMLREGLKDIISLDVGEPCFDTPDNIKKAAWEALKAGKTKYEPAAGAYELREAIREKLRRENNIGVEVDDIIVTPGAKFAIFLAFQALLEKGKRVMLLDPSWVSYEPAARIAGADVVRVASSKANRSQPDLEAISEAIDNSIKIIVVNSPCNPTGAVYDKSTIRGIAKIAKDHGAVILSDEIYEYLIYEGKHYSPASEFNNVITVNGFSKSYAMTGWRLGYVTGPKKIIEGMIKICQHSVTCVTAFAQAGAIEALTAGKSQRAVEQMIEAYTEKRTLITDLIERSEFFNCLAPRGAFYTFPSYSFDKPSVELAKELLEKVHVATVPGAAFGKCGEGHLRLSFASSNQDMVEGFNRMETFLKRCA